MSTVIQFTKMHGLGNDFVVIDAINQSIHLTAEQIRFLADRHLGIGCDQILLVEKSSDPAIDFFYRIYNADGSEVGQCGNGARCLAKFVTEKQLTNKKQLRVKTNTTTLELIVLANNFICVNMGIPQDIRQVMVDGFIGFALDMGNPHLVFLDTIFSSYDLNTEFIQNMGQHCNQHPLFPTGVNVGFMRIIDRNTIALRVYERGVGETQACGSGACAAAVAGIYQNLLNHQVTVKLSGGDLNISWQGKQSSLLMTGSATTVFQGEVCI